MGLVEENTNQASSACLRPKGIEGNKRLSKIADEVLWGGCASESYDDILLRIVTEQCRLRVGSRFVEILDYCSAVRWGRADISIGCGCVLGVATDEGILLAGD